MLSIWRTCLLQKLRRPGGKSRPVVRRLYYRYRHMRAHMFVHLYSFLYSSSVCHPVYQRLNNELTVEDLFDQLVRELAEKEQQMRHLKQEHCKVSQKHEVQIVCHLGEFRLIRTWWFADRFRGLTCRDGYVCCIVLYLWLAFASMCTK